MTEEQDKDHKTSNFLSKQMPEPTIRKVRPKCALGEAIGVPTKKCLNSRFTYLSTSLNGGKKAANAG
jgi:hypothetical protein